MINEEVRFNSNWDKESESERDYFDYREAKD